MSDILGTAARAVQKKSDYDLSDDTAERIATAVVAAVTPLIRAQVLEQAAAAAETRDLGDNSPQDGLAQEIAVAIRALKEQP